MRRSLLLLIFKLMFSDWDVSLSLVYFFNISLIALGLNKHH